MPQLLFWSLLFAAEQNNRHVVESGPAEQLILPPPNTTRAVANPPSIVLWPDGKTPTAPKGFEVSLFADGLENPRMVYVLPNGDVLVMESLRESGSRIILLRDTEKTGKPPFRQTFVRRLNKAFGMALVDNRFYVGNTDSVVVFPYRSGDIQLKRQPEKILDLPTGGHYTRAVVADAKGKKLYVSVGSATNVDEQRLDEKDSRRAAILEMNSDGSAMRVFAGGMRNPVGMDWEPTTNTLWTVVNERDMLGDELVPDYLTRVRDGAFYGWPYSYYGQNEDPRKKGQRPKIWSPKQSNPTTRSARTSRRWAWRSTAARVFPSAITAALSSACTDLGIGPIWLVTKLPSCHLKTANRAAQSKIFLPALSPTRRAAKFTVGLSASPLGPTVRCSSPTTPLEKFGASAR